MDEQRTAEQYGANRVLPRQGLGEAPGLHPLHGDQTERMREQMQDNEQRQHQSGKQARLPFTHALKRSTLRKVVSPHRSSICEYIFNRHKPGAWNGDFKRQDGSSAAALGHAEHTA
jgi:hypothetical protein